MDTKFHVNPLGGSRVLPCGRTAGQRQADRHGAANCRFSQFYERAEKNKRGRIKLQKFVIIETATELLLAYLDRRNGA